jgi:transposase InsO family protein
VLNEFYLVAFRRKIYSSIEHLQADLDSWLREYNELRPHQGRWCYGKTPAIGCFGFCWRGDGRVSLTTW